MVFEKILVPTDFSPWSDAALALIPSLRRVGAREAILFHALDPRALLPWFEALRGANALVEEKAHQELQKRRDQMVSLGLQVQVRLVSRSPLEAIIQCAAEEGAHLILMGSRQRSFLKQMVLGSVSENVIRHAPVPILLNKGSGATDEPASDRPYLFEHVLFPTDFSLCSEKAFQCLLALARAGMRKATIIHVQDIRFLTTHTADCEGSVGALSLPHLEQLVDMDYLVQHQHDLEALGVETRLLLREGIPFREILRAAEEERATAIVLGSHGRSSIAEMLLGSVSAEVIRQAQVPTLVVRRDLGEPV